MLQSALYGGVRAVKKILVFIWLLSFSLISYVVLYQAYVSPYENNHAVGIALVSFLVINFPVGFLTIRTPWWDDLTLFGQFIGLPLGWSEGVHVLLLNGVVGAVWWFIVLPKAIEFFKK